MAEQQEKGVTANLVQAFSEANRALADNLIAARERNLKYTQSVFETTMEVLKKQAESARSLLEQWEQQVQNQQATLQKLPLVPTEAKAVEAYLALLRAPLTIYQNELELVETASQQGFENFQKTTENFQKLMQQGQERWQEAIQQAQHVLGKPGGNQPT